MLTGIVSLAEADLYTQFDQQMHNLGALGVDQKGDFYRFAYVGASAISAGKIQLAPAQKTNHHNVALSEALSADTTKRLKPTMGATAVVVNEYAGGILAVNDATGEGTTYDIVGNRASLSAGVADIELERPLWESLTTSSEVTVVHNAYNGVVEAAVATRRAAGVPLRDLAANKYGWLKTKGVCSVLCDGAIAIGSWFSPSASVAGAAAILSTTFSAALATFWVGQAAAVAGVDTEYTPLVLRID